MEKALKILAIAPTPFFSDRGRHVHILEQIKALQKLNIEVILATYGHGREVSDITTVRAPKFPWHTKVTSGPSWHKIYMDFFLLFTILRAARREKPDIIHAYTHEGCLLGAFVSRVFNIPLVFDHQGSMTTELASYNFFFTRDKLWRNAMYKIEHWINKRADAILTQSEQTRDDLIHKAFVPQSKISLIYDAVDVNVFKPGPKNKSLLEKYNIPPDSPAVIFLGSLFAYQGVDTLLYAWRSVRYKIHDAILIIMGYPNVHYYKKMAKVLGVVHSVRFTGRIKYEKAPVYLRLGDIAVSPKISEIEDNIKVYNYMACGLPTVAFNTVVNRNILGELGAFVDVNGDNHKGLADKIIELLQDKNERQRLASKVRQKAIKEHGWANVAVQIQKIYREILKSK